jgi:hypothetical protein
MDEDEVVNCRAGVEPLAWAAPFEAAVTGGRPTAAVRDGFEDEAFGGEDEVFATVFTTDLCVGPRAMVVAE